MNIRNIIKQKGFSLSNVAKQMKSKNPDKEGISLPAMIQIIDGNPTIDKLKEIASIIGVSLSELVSDEEESHKSSITCPHCGKPINIKIE